MRVVMAVGYAFGLDYEQALEGVDYFLDYFPVLRGGLDAIEVALDDLVDLLVFFYEDQDQVMRGFTHFRLHLIYLYVLIGEQGH